MSEATNREFLERLQWETAAWLQSIGYMRRGMNYPRWDFRKFVAKDALNLWRYCKDCGYRTERHHALYVLAMQTFAGLRPEWVERRYPWNKRSNT